MEQNYHAEELKKSLLRKLVESTTINQEKCSSFLITNDLSRVRVSESMGVSSRGTEESLNAEELSSFLIRKATEEENALSGSEKSRKAIIIHRGYSLLIKLGVEIGQKIEKMRKECEEAMEENLKRDFLDFLNEIQSPDFEKRLDFLLANEAKASQMFWEEELLAKIQRSFSSFESDLKEALSKCKELMGKLLQKKIELKGFMEPLKLKAFWQTQNLIEKTKSKREKGGSKSEDIREFSSGVSMISKRLENDSEFAVVSTEGHLAIINAREDKVVVSQQLDTGETMESFNFVDFSPSGDFVLVGTSKNGFLHAFEANSLELTDKWQNQNGNELKTAKWIDDEHILASFKERGQLLIFKRGHESSIHQIPLSKKETVVCFDISSCKEQIYSGTEETKLVCKFNIQRNESSDVVWEHNGHNSTVAFVRLSNKETHVVSGGNDKKVIVAKAMKGEIIMSFSDFKQNQITGVAWAPNDKFLIASTKRELVLLGMMEKVKKIEMHKKKMKKIDEEEEESQQVLYKIKECDLEQEIGSFDVEWRPENPEESLVVFGKSMDFLFKVRLTNTEHLSRKQLKEMPMKSDRKKSAMKSKF